MGSRICLNMTECENVQHTKAHNFLFLCFILILLPPTFFSSFSFITSYSSFLFPSPLFSHFLLSTQEQGAKRNLRRSDIFKTDFILGLAMYCMPVILAYITVSVLEIYCFIFYLYVVSNSVDISALLPPYFQYADFLLCIIWYSIS